MPDSAASSSIAAAPSAPSAPDARFQRERVELWLLLAVVAAQLLPLAFLRFLPTQDGPSHQALAYALRVFDQPEGAPLRELLVRNEEALPNAFLFFLHANVLAFLSTLAAEKVLVAAYFVLLPLGVRYALRALRPDAGFLAVLALPFTCNLLLGLGFLSFCWSLAAFAFALGFYLRHEVRFGAAAVVGMALLAGWVYLCHPIALVMLTIAVVGWGGWQAWLASRGSRPRLHTLASEARVRLLLPLLALAPALLLLAAFVGRRIDRPTGGVGPWVKAKQLFALYSLVSFDRRTLAFAIGTALVLGGLAALLVLRRRRAGETVAQRGDALLLVAALFTAVYFAAPSNLSGGGFVNQRLALFPPLALLLWLGNGVWSPRMRATVQLLGAVLAIGMLVTLWTRWSRLDRELAEYVAVAERVEDGAAVLPLGFAPAGLDGDGRPLAFRVWPFVHALGYVAGRRPVVDLGLYEAGEDYFPLRFRPDRDPYRHLSVGPVGVEEVPPRVDFGRYAAHGGRVDYVLLWQPVAAPPRHPATVELYRQLHARFERTHVSAGGKAELWRARRVPSPVAGQAARP